MNFKAINISCPINGTGYGITSLNIVKSLSANDVDISLFPISNDIHVNSAEDKEILKPMFQKSASFSYSAPCLKIWHQYDLATKIGNGHYYAFPFFEVDKMTEREVHHLNYPDFIFVASEWGKKVLQNNGVNKPIYVAPLGADLSIFNAPPKIKLQKNKYTFFHIGKWEVRKSQDFLIQCFDAAFNEDDDVELWLVPHNPFLNKEETEKWYDLVRSAKLRSKINIIERLPTQYDLAQLIDRCDCGVFLSRAEGWNNSIIECMAMNKPIIATNYSAHTEYLTPENSLMVNVTETEPANDGKWFNGFGNWAKLGQDQFTQTIDYMRYVYSKNIQSNPHGLETSKKYVWSNTAKIILDTFNRNNSYYANTKARTKRRR